jgi:hypothetical protein
LRLQVRSSPHKPLRILCITIALRREKEARKQRLCMTPNVGQQWETTYDKPQMSLMQFAKTRVLANEPLTLLTMQTTFIDLSHSFPVPIHPEVFYFYFQGGTEVTSKSDDPHDLYTAGQHRKGHRQHHTDDNSAWPGSLNMSSVQVTLQTRTSSSLILLSAPSKKYHTGRVLSVKKVTVFHRSVCKCISGRAHCVIAGSASAVLVQRLWDLQARVGSCNTCIGVFVALPRYVSGAERSLSLSPAHCQSL